MKEAMLVDLATMYLQFSSVALVGAGIAHRMETAEARKLKKAKKLAFEKKRAQVKKQIARDKMAKQRRMEEISLKLKHNQEFNNMKSKKSNRKIS